MGDSRGLDERVEADWRGFRGRLADRLEELDDDGWLRMEGEAGEGPTPFLQFAAFGDTIRAEAAGGALDAHWATPPHLQPRLELVWNAPTAIEPYLYTVCPRREVDRLAAESVDVLRHLLNVVHPSSSTSDGLEVDPAVRRPARPVREPRRPRRPRRARRAADVPDVARPPPRPRRRSVAGAAPGRRGPVGPGRRRPGPVRPVVGVRAGSQRSPRGRGLRRDRAGRGRLRPPVDGSLSFLNESHPYAKFFVRGEAVVMSYVLSTLPFVPHQFRLMTEAFLNEVDDVARALATRLDARRFFDPEPEPIPEPTLADLYPSLAMMLELMARPPPDVGPHRSPVRPRPARGLGDDRCGARRAGRPRRRRLRPCPRAAPQGTARHRGRRGRATPPRARRCHGSHVRARSRCSATVRSASRASTCGVGPDARGAAPLASTHDHGS